MTTPNRRYSCMLSVSDVHPLLVFYQPLTLSLTSSHTPHTPSHTLTHLTHLPFLSYTHPLSLPHRYVSSQAVHDPFADNNGKFPDGVPRTYMNPETYDYIYSTYQGGKVREYYKSLAVLDRSIESSIYQTYHRTIEPYHRTIP